MMEFDFNQANSGWFLSHPTNCAENQAISNRSCKDVQKSECKHTAQQPPVIDETKNLFCPKTEQNLSVENIQYIWCSEYSTEIIDSLRESEKKRKKIHYKSPQKQFRSSLVQVIKYSAHILRLNRTTVHLAVYLLDVFMDTYAIIQTKLNAVALTCLLVASKIEERDTNVPKLERLSKISRRNNIHELKNAEIKLLNFFEWNLLLPTAATYIEYYIANIVSKSDMQKLLDQKMCIASENQITEEVNAQLFDILDLTLQDQCLVQAIPSITAAACLAVTRKTMGLCKWNNDMFVMTGYQFCKIQKTYEGLLSLKRKKDEALTNVILWPKNDFFTSSESESEPETYFEGLQTPKRRRIN